MKKKGKRSRLKKEPKSLLESRTRSSLSLPLSLSPSHPLFFFSMSALSPTTIALAAVAVARAAREYLDTLSDEQAETVT